jgi:putative transposase
VRYAWIEAQADWQPIARLCKVLGVSRSGFLQWRDRAPSDRELANRSLDAQVAVIHAEGKQGYGRIRVTRRLRQSGTRVGAERVRKSLLRQSLRSVYRKKSSRNGLEPSKASCAKPARSALRWLGTKSGLDNRHHLPTYR